MTGRYDLTMDGRVRYTEKADGTGPYRVLTGQEVVKLLNGKNHAEYMRGFTDGVRDAMGEDED